MDGADRKRMSGGGRVVGGPKSAAAVGKQRTRMRRHPSPKPPRSGGRAEEMDGNDLVASRSSAAAAPAPASAWDVCGSCRLPLDRPPPSPSSPNSTAASATAAHPAAPVAVVVCANATRSSILNNANGGRKQGAGAGAAKCPHPRFHLTCSSIPVGSRLYRDAVTDHYARSCGGGGGGSSSSSIRGSNNDAPSPSSPGKSDPYSLAHSHHHPPTVEQILCGYLCPSCDVEGTARYLTEYFESYRTAKVSFCRGKVKDEEDAVDAICPASGVGRSFVAHLVGSVAGGGDGDGEGGGGGTCSNGGGKSGTCSKGGGGSARRNNGRHAKRFKASEVRLDHIAQILGGIVRGGEGAKSQQLGKDHDKEEEGEQTCSRADSGKQKSSSINSSRSFAQSEKELNSDNELDPSFLLGQPVRLYNPVERAYHVGRIIDWRHVAAAEQDENDAADVDDPSRQSVPQSPLSTSLRSSPPSSPTKHQQQKEKQQQHPRIDHRVGQTQYLLRFRPNVDGRKVPVHQWAFLEEHALSVGVALVWGDAVGGARRAVGEEGGAVGKKKGKGENSKCFEEQKKKEWARHRPAQIVVRTALEMVPVRELNELVGNDASPHAAAASASSVNALALFFGRVFHHAVLHLERGGADNMCEKDHLEEEENKKKKYGRQSSSEAAAATTDTTTAAAAAAKTTPLFTAAAADFTDPPPTLEACLRRKVHYHDRPLAISTASACMEREEQRRVWEWHRLNENGCSSSLPPTDGATKASSGNGGGGGGSFMHFWGGSAAAAAAGTPRGKGNPCNGASLTAPPRPRHVPATITKPTNVWVTEGKTEHAALFLPNDDGGGVGEGRARIKWSNGTVSSVPLTDVNFDFDRGATKRTAR